MHSRNKGILLLHLSSSVSSTKGKVRIKNLSLLLLAKKQIYMVPSTFILRMALVETIGEMWNIQELIILLDLVFLMLQRWLSLKTCLRSFNSEFTFEDHLVTCYHRQVKILLISSYCEPLNQPDTELKSYLPSRTGFFQNRHL